MSIAADGTLMGALGLNVNGTLYDVTFGDDVVANGITAFTNLTDAYAASQVLLDQVMIGDYGLTGSKLINGCTDTLGCSIATVYSISTGRGRPASTASAKVLRNLQISQVQQTVAGVSSSTNTNDLASSTLAKWTVSAPAVSAVPVPAAAWLFGSGLLGLVGLRRRQQQA